MQWLKVIHIVTTFSLSSDVSEEDFEILLHYSIPYDNKERKFTVMPLSEFFTELTRAGKQLQVSSHIIVRAIICLSDKA